MRFVIPVVFYEINNVECVYLSNTMIFIVAVPYVENTLYSTNKYCCVRRVHTLYISYYRI